MSWRWNCAAAFLIRSASTPPASGSGIVTRTASDRTAAGMSHGADIASASTAAALAKSQRSGSSRKNLQLNLQSLLSFTVTHPIEPAAATSRPSGNGVFSRRGRGFATSMRYLKTETQYTAGRRLQDLDRAAPGSTSPGGRGYRQPFEWVTTIGPKSERHNPDTCPGLSGFVRVTARGNPSGINRLVVYATWTRKSVLVRPGCFLHLHVAPRAPQIHPIGAPPHHASRAARRHGYSITHRTGHHHFTGIGTTQPGRVSGFVRVVTRGHAFRINRLGILQRGHRRTVLSVQAVFRRLQADPRAPEHLRIGVPALLAGSIEIVCHCSSP